MSDSTIDVIVVGGGISGMSAAKSLHDAGRRVVVVEANNRFGGRSFSEPAEGGVLENGGMYIGEDHHASIALGESLGMTRTPTWPSGEDVYFLAGERVVSVDGALPEDNPHAAPLRESFDAIDALATEVGWEAPWNHPRAVELDARTVEDWLGETVQDPIARMVHRDFIKPLMGADPIDMSLLFWAYYVAQCGGIAPLLATSGGAQNEWWVEGASTVSSRIGELLGEDALLDWPVDVIEHSADEVVVVSGGRRLVAKRLILAVPPASANRIRFSPPLEGRRDQLQMRAPLGRVAKVVLRYDRRFWADDRLSGAVVYAGDDMSFVQLDATKQEDPGGTLVGFIGGAGYDTWRALSEDERRERYLAVIVAAIGPDAAKPAYYSTTDWSSERFSRGAPVTFLPPGVMTAYGRALRGSFGRIHIAGTEASLQHAGYMEGGVRAGQAAASAALAAAQADASLV